MAFVSQSPRKGIDIQTDNDVGPGSYQSEFSSFVKASRQSKNKPAFGIAGERSLNKSNATSLYTPGKIKGT